MDNEIEQLKKDIAEGIKADIREEIQREELPTKASILKIKDRAKRQQMIKKHLNLFEN